MLPARAARPPPPARMRSTSSLPRRRGASAPQLVGQHQVDAAGARGAATAGGAHAQHQHELPARRPPAPG